MNLAGALVASGLVGIVAVALTRLLGDSSSFQKSVQMKNDVESVKMVLMKRISCEATIASLGTSCTPGELIELKELRGGDTRTLVKNEDPPTRFGKIAVRAECSPDGLGVIVKSAWLREGKSISSEEEKDFLSDPIFNKRLSWSNPKTSILFPAGLNICSLRATSSNKPSCYKVHPSNPCLKDFNKNYIFVHKGAEQCDRVTVGGDILNYCQDISEDDIGREIECLDLNTKERFSICDDGYVYSGTFRTDCARYAATKAGPHTCTRVRPVIVLCCRP